MLESKTTEGGIIVGKLEIEGRVEALEKRITELEKERPGQPEAPDFKVIDKGRLTV